MVLYQVMINWVDDIFMTTSFCNNAREACINALSELDNRLGIRRSKESWKSNIKKISLKSFDEITTRYKGSVWIQVRDSRVGGNKPCYYITNRGYQDVL